MQALSVNGTEIPFAAIAAESQNHPSSNPDGATEMAAHALIVRELLLQEACRLGLTPEPLADDAGRVETEDGALIRQLLDEVIEVPEAGEGECRRYYDNNIARFRSPDVFEPSHILLAADRQDEAKFAASVAEAEAIIRALRDTPGAFEDFARQRSDCASRDQGGKMGQITRGQTTPEFETFLFALAEGQLCPEPVKAPYGVHVLRLDRKQTGRTQPFDLVHDRIAQYLSEASWRQAVSQYIVLLYGRATICGLGGEPALRERA